jgi:hypothetical protein
VRSIAAAAAAVVVAAATAVKLLHYRGACSVLVVKPLAAATAVKACSGSTGIGPNVSER